MTLKENAIREVETKIKQKEREINQLQEELLSLNKKLEDYKNIPDSYYDTMLKSCEDFPLGYQWCLRIGGLLKTPGEKGDVTINELIHSSNKQLLELSGFGEGKLKLLEEWMEKHGLHFIS